MYRITISDCERAINNANKVNNETIKIWNNCLKKLQTDLTFSSKEDLESQLTLEHNYSTAYKICGLLRAACKINEVNMEIKDIVYPLYRELRTKSGDEQLENRMKMKQWTLEQLIETMRDIEMVDHKTIMLKLFIAMYTINPPLRNDYDSVKLITEHNDNEDYIDLNNKILNVYVIKSKKFKQTTLSDELIDIIKESLVILPRKYLFTKINGQPYKSKMSFYTYIMKHLKKLFNDEDFSINTFRHAYAEWSLKQDTRTRLKAADEMMHSRYKHLEY